MKATLTYRCDDPDHEQKFRIVARRNDDNTTSITATFDPPCSDDTSDPTGLLGAAINCLDYFRNLAKSQVEEIGV